MKYIFQVQQTGFQWGVERKGILKLSAFVTELMVASLTEMGKSGLWKENQEFCFEYIEFEIPVSYSNKEIKM